MMSSYMVIGAVGAIAGVVIGAIVGVVISIGKGKSEKNDDTTV